MSNRAPGMCQVPTPESVIYRAMALLEEHVKADPSLHGIAAGVAAAQQEGDRLQLLVIDSIAEPELRPACRKGCSFCCYIQVVVTPPEIVALISEIKNWSLADKVALRDEVVRLDSLHHGQPPGKGRGIFPCPLLKDGLCRVYEQRPFSCRSYHSLDREICAASFEDDCTHSIPGISEIQAQPQLAQLGVSTALMECGFEPEPLELVAALRVVLEDPTALLSWIDGAPVFASAQAPYTENPAVQDRMELTDYLAGKRPE